MITFERLAAPFGSQVHGLDVERLDADGLGEALVDELHNQSVLVVRNIELSADELIRFSGLFGTVSPMARREEALASHPQIVEVTNVRNDQIVVDNETAADNLKPPWYADGSYLAVPPRCSIGYAIEVPSRGGQTQFADMRRALLLLPPEDRHEIEQLQLVHGLEADADTAVEHPWVRTNSDGSESLYMGTHASHIVGRGVDESRQWFAEVEAQLPVHDVFYEHQWRPHDLIVYDNRTVMHRTLGYDIANERRVLHRITIAGDPTDWLAAD